MKHLMNFEQYTTNEGITFGITKKDIEMVKNNHNGIKQMFEKVYGNLLKYERIRKAFEKALDNDLDSLYKCLLDGILDNFKSSLIIKDNKLQYLIGYDIKNADFDPAQL